MRKALRSGLLTALLLNLSFEPFGQGYLAFVVLIPILKQLDRPWRERLAAGWMAGFGLQMIGFYWIFYTIRDFGGLNVVFSAGGGLLFWLYQGLDLGILLLVAPFLARRGPAWARAAALALAWTLIHARLFPYVFPWSLGASMTSVPLLRESASFWSSDGLSFLLFFAQAWFVFATPKGARFPRFSPWFLCLLLWPLGALANASFRGSPAKTRVMRVALVQPNLIPWAKRDPMGGDEIFREHYKPSELLIGQQIDLLLWPETAVPFNLSQSEYHQEQMTRLAESLGAPLVSGAVGVYEEGYFNEIWMMDPNGRIPQRYQKERLVLFSERLPWLLEWALFFDKNLGAFSVGIHNEAFHCDEMSFVPLVCYEALFPDYVRKRQGMLMLNLTNDAWFGVTKASAQHLQHIRLRCCESGVPMVRATNSGISCWIDAQGRVHEPTGLYAKALPIYEVPVPEQIPENYTKFGERLLLLFGLVGLLLSQFPRPTIAKPL